MKEFILFTAASLAFVTIIMTPLLFVGNILNKAQCANNVQEMGKEYRYDFINGCRIGLEDGTYIYWRMYREIEDND